jgi:LmbE family N-acetylglucosaminyl deacetylase
MTKTVLAIGTHPDDIEIGCGGTLMLLKDQGYQLVHLIVTSGEEGSNLISKRDLTLKREGEAKESAQFLGTANVIFLKELDGLTAFSKETKIKLISILREVRPEIIFTHSSSDFFPDHQIVHQLSHAAIVGASGPWYSEAGFVPHQVKNIYGYEVWNPMPKYQLAMDISSVIEQKLQALRIHSSQVNKIDYVEAIRGLGRYRGVMTMTGEYAEAFEVLHIGGLR